MIFTGLKVALNINVLSSGNPGKKKSRKKRREMRMWRRLM